MPETIRILLLDSEEAFLHATQALLSKEGYECDVAREGSAALSKLSTHRHDLLISDIDVPGNADLEFVREVSERWELPVILVARYPSLRTAIRAIELSVVAYLVKPFEFADLLPHVQATVARSRITNILQSARADVETWASHSSVWNGSAPLGWRRGDQLTGFLSRIIENVQLSLCTMARLTLAVAESNGTIGDVPCHLLDCPRGRALEALLQETIQSLEKTRSAFKSKELGDLRRKIEKALAGEP